MSPASLHSCPSRQLKQTNELIIRVIGLSDGLTVPFALTAGLSAIGSSKLVVSAGLAELIAGAISMGVGGYRTSFHRSIPRCVASPLEVRVISRVRTDTQSHRKPSWTTFTIPSARRAIASPVRALARWSARCMPCWDRWVCGRACRG